MDTRLVAAGQTPPTIAMLYRRCVHIHHPTTHSAYLDRLDCYRQRIWTCKATGTSNLTYEQALASEVKAKALTSRVGWWRVWGLEKGVERKGVERGGIWGRGGLVWALHCVLHVCLRRMTALAACTRPGAHIIYTQKKTFPTQFPACYEAPVIQGFVHHSTLKPEELCTKVWCVCVVRMCIMGGVCHFPHSIVHPTSKLLSIFLTYTYTHAHTTTTTSQPQQQRFLHIFEIGW